MKLSNDWICEGREVSLEVEKIAKWVAKLYISINVTRIARRTLQTRKKISHGNASKYFQTL